MGASEGPEYYNLMSWGLQEGRKKKNEPLILILASTSPKCFYFISMFPFLFLLPALSSPSFSPLRASSLLVGTCSRTCEPPPHGERDGQQRKRGDAAIFPAPR